VAIGLKSIMIVAEIERDTIKNNFYHGKENWGNCIILGGSSIITGKKGWYFRKDKTIS